MSDVAFGNLVCLLKTGFLGEKRGVLQIVLRNSLCSITVSTEPSPPSRLRWQLPQIGYRHVRLLADAHEFLPASEHWLAETGEFLPTGEVVKAT